MRENFDKAFEIVVGLEGHVSDDPGDPGGFTIWGLSSKYNPVTRNTTLEQAKAIYLRQYWGPASCDIQPFPMDICMFDGAVNPQNDPTTPSSGNHEILSFDPLMDWREFLLFRLIRYANNSKPQYKQGHQNRIYRLYNEIRKIQGKRPGWSI